MAFNPNEFVEFQAPKRRYQDELREQVLRRHHYREVIEGMPGGENTVIHLIPSGDTLEELLVAGACQTPLKSNPGEKFWPFMVRLGWVKRGPNAQKKFVEADPPEWAVVERDTVWEGHTIPFNV